MSFTREFFEQLLNITFDPSRREWIYLYADDDVALEEAKATIKAIVSDVLVIEVNQEQENEKTKELECWDEVYFIPISAIKEFYILGISWEEILKRKNNADKIKERMNEILEKAKGTLTEDDIKFVKSTIKSAVG